MFGEWVVKRIILEREFLVERGDLIDDCEDCDEDATYGDISKHEAGRRSCARMFGLDSHYDQVVANISAPVSL